MTDTMSMVWMPMPGQSWLGAMGSFLAMWVVMMAAMMLPSLVPMLRRYRDEIAGTRTARRGQLTAVVGAGYLFVWTAVGIAAFVLGAGFMRIDMQQPLIARVAPIAIGVVVLVAGACQFTTWKAHALACCRQGIGLGRVLPADTRTAWRHGVRLGLHCARCCGNLMAILLVVGVMDLSAMAVLTMGITLERLAPAGERAAHAIGAVVLAAGACIIARAAWLTY